MSYSPLFEPSIERIGLAVELRAQLRLGLTTLQLCDYVVLRDIYVVARSSVHRAIILVDTSQFNSLRLPFRHSGENKKGKHTRLPGAEDEIRTRDLLLGKETRYRCATSANYPKIIAKPPASVKQRARTLPRYPLLSFSPLRLYRHDRNRRSEGKINLL